jgi:branched-chain amino acid transport system permease protein
MRLFIERHPLRALIVLVAIAAALWLIFATWPAGLEDTFGKKKVFLSAVFNGITLGGLYFLVASGFTLIFGLMRNVNLAHGSLYLFGGYIGYAVSLATGSWLLSFITAFLVVALVGVALQILVFRRIEGQDRAVDRLRRPDVVGLRRRFLPDPDPERAGRPDPAAVRHRGQILR